MYLCAEIITTKMCTNHWYLNEGFIIGGVIILAGLLLQAITGPVLWDIIAWPYNAITVAVFLLLIIGSHALRHKFYVLRYLTTFNAAVSSMTYTLVLTIVMGLTKQYEGGKGINDMLTYWPFVTSYIYMAFILGLVTVKRFFVMLTSFNLKNIAFMLNHAGLFIALVAGTLGNPDMHRLRMITEEGFIEYRAMNEEKHIVEMPMSIKLDKFLMETYDDGSPRRYASILKIYTPDGKEYSGTVEVNNPLRFGKWKIYQYGYDTVAGKNRWISILELVCDPWLPIVYTGIIMMLLGAILMFIKIR